MKLKKRFKYNKSKMFVYLFIALAFSGVSLGYAFLSTDLDINGALKVAKSSWDIHFENVQVNENSSNSVTGSSGVPTISNDTTVNFSVGLDNPGEFYEFTVDVVNDGTINAKIGGIEILPQLTNEQKKYFEYKVTYSDGVEIKLNDALNAGDTETLLIRFKYLENDDNSVYPEEDVDFDFSVSIDYVQADDNAEEVEHSSYVYTANKINSSTTEPIYNSVWLNQTFPASIAQYQTASEALAAIATASGKNLPFYLKHKIKNGIVTESYVEFVVTEEMAEANTGMVAGTYTLRGGINESSLTDKPIYIQNAKTIYDAFGTKCSTNPYTTTITSSNFGCRVSGLGATAYANGFVYAYDSVSSICNVSISGYSYCDW